MRTIVYIDGFNLYFGCLKRAPNCRWLDLEKLVRRLTVENNPEAHVTQVKYFTARVKASVSPDGVRSANAQDHYLRALSAHSLALEIVEGSFFIVQGHYYADENPIDFDKKYKVLRPEEKQTDVNITLHMLSDATDGVCDQQILFSNDSDFAPIFRTIKARHPAILLGVVPPIIQGAGQYPGSELAKSSDWSRGWIERVILEQCQLLERIQARKRMIRRPAHWCSDE